MALRITSITVVYKSLFLCQISPYAVQLEKLEIYNSWYEKPSSRVTAITGFSDDP